MTYSAVEVEIRDGRVTSCSGEALPLHARALLVVLDTPPSCDPGDVEAILKTLDDIQARQTARGHHPPTPEEVTQRVRRERESWD